MKYMILKDPSSKRKLPPKPDYNVLKPLPPQTRSSLAASCPCHICHIARMKNQDYLKYKAEHSNPVGAPEKHSESEESSPQKIIQVCNKCFSSVGQGKKHICSSKSFCENVVEIVNNNTVRARDKVTCDLLKIKANEQGTSTRGGEVKIGSNSKTLPVKIGSDKVKPKPSKYSHEALIQIQTANNLSDNTIK